MKTTRLLTLSGLIAILLATSACHRHWHHWHRHHAQAGQTVEPVSVAGIAGGAGAVTIPGRA